MGGHKILFRHCKFKVITLHANKACGEVWLRLRVFLTLVLGGSEWSSLFRGRLTRGEKKKPPLIPTEQEAGWAPELVWKLYR